MHTSSASTTSASRASRNSAAATRLGSPTEYNTLRCNTMTMTITITITITIIIVINITIVTYSNNMITIMVTIV